MYHKVSKRVTYCIMYLRSKRLWKAVSKAFGKKGAHTGDFSRGTRDNTADAQQVRRG